jgi:hypothetical protein
LTSSADFGPGSWPVATIDLQPAPTFRLGDEVQEGYFGLARTEDAPYPYEWVNPTFDEPLLIPMGTEVRVTGDADVEELLYGDAEQLDAGAGLDSGVIWADQPDFSEPYFLPWFDEPERTYLKLFGTWGDGAVLDVYFEVVFVEPTWDVSDDTADIAVSPEPMEAALIYGGQRMPAALNGGQYGRASITTELTGWDEDSIFATVAAGSSITVSGDHLVEASAHFGPLPFGAEEGAIVESFPEEPGRSILTLDVTWDDGRATFLFPIEIVAAPQEDGRSPDEGVSPAPVPTDAVSIDIRRADAPTSKDPRAVARFGEEEIRMCPNGWSLVGPDEERNEVLFDCGQEREFTAAAGASVMVTGDFVTIDVTAVGHEDRTQYAPNEVPGLEPGSIVTFTFDVEWTDGSEASFWLLLTVSEGPPAAQTSILEIRCGRDGAEILTPVVLAQPDGVHIQVDNPFGVAALEFANAVSPDGWFGGPIDEVIRVWPIEPGEFFVECLERLSDSYQGLETARFEVVDPFGYWVPGSPECGEGDDLLRVDAYDGGGAHYVDDETTIRALLHSIEPMDEVRLPFYSEGSGAKDLRYVVVRNDRVIAALLVGVSDDEDPYGPGLAEVTGRACASSGIAQGSIG